jgi:outer membrane biosynthesis protein TonB
MRYACETRNTSGVAPGVFPCNLHRTMQQHPRSRLRGRIGRGLLLSIFLHAQVLMPLVAWLFWWNKGEDEDVQVTFEDVKESELPSDLPPIEQPAEPRRPSPQINPPKPKSPELALQEPRPLQPTPVEPKPVEKKPEETKQENPQDKPKAQAIDLQHEKIVDLDMGKEVEAPKDAKYLAQRNNRTDNETRARQTNLDRAQQGKPAEPSDDEDKIAHAEEREAKAGQRGEPGSDQQPAPRSPLSMRAPGVEGAGSPGEKLEESADGLLSKPRRGRPGKEGDPRASVSEERPTPHLTHQGYASAFGDDSALSKAMAKQEKSKHKGKFAEHKEKVLAALENFVNEVKPGNQTELNTRAAPFAQFITHMHRQIHEKWAFGFLTQMDTSFRDSPMNDLKLVTKLEIVLAGDGKVDKIAMVRTSGSTGFDAAAISSVYAAEPFPTPPAAILSGNGKVYLHWKFHRNGDACGTPGVTYFILDNGDKKSDGKNPRAAGSTENPASG